MQQLKNNEADKTAVGHDLAYIPDNPLHVEVDSFEGPLDLLSYLVKKNNFNILNIPINVLTKQYIIYLDSMEKQKIEVISNYLLMLSELIEIKSQMLLPRSKRSDEEVDEDDLRKKLVERLRTYKIFKEIALKLQCIAANKPPIAKASTEHLIEDGDEVDFLVQPTITDLVGCYRDILERNSYEEPIELKKEKFSVNSRKVKISNVMYKNNNNEQIKFNEFFNKEEGRSGVVVSFLALLDMTKENLIDLNVIEKQLLVRKSF